MEDSQFTIGQELGRMDARIDNIEKDVSELKGDVKTLLARSSEIKGGDRRLLTIGGGGVSVGALIVAAGQWLGGQPERAPEPAPVRPAVSQPMHAPVDDPSNRQ